MHHIILLFKLFLVTVQARCVSRSEVSHLPIFHFVNKALPIILSLYWLISLEGNRTELSFSDYTGVTFFQCNHFLIDLEIS